MFGQHSLLENRGILQWEEEVYWDVSYQMKLVKTTLQTEQFFVDPLLID